MTVYNGFSTLGRNKKFKLTDFELAKVDLYNHLNIRPGEKLMNPQFGTVIWGMLFEPLDETSTEIIKKDINRILSYDPRLRAETIELRTFESGIQLTMHLRYIPDNQTDVIMFKFDSTS